MPLDYRTHIDVRPVALIPAPTRMGERDRAAHPVPDTACPRAWIAWAYDELAVIAAVVDDLPGPPTRLGAARTAPDEPRLAGLAFVRAGTPHAIWTLAHELGHLRTGTCGPLDTARPVAAPAREDAERAADHYAMGLLIDEAALRRAVRAGETPSEIGMRLRVPAPYVAYRCHQLGIVLRAMVETPEQHEAIAGMMRAAGCPERWPRTDPRDVLGRR